MKSPFRRGEVSSPDPDFIKDSRDAERVGKLNPYIASLPVEATLVIEKCSANC